MNRIAVPSTLGVMLAFCLVSLAWADFQKGLDAYKHFDYSAAFQEFRPLADSGHTQAQYYLGEIYLYGQGVPQDFAEAYRWYHRAAEKGNVEAQSKLGEISAKGRGVPRDVVQAHKWFNLAAAHGDEDAPSRRDDIATKMTSAQIATAQKLALEWKPQR